jgi:hypothetical protein
MAAMAAFPLNDRAVFEDRGTGAVPYDPTIWRVTRPAGAVLPFARELDLALQPTRSQLRTAIETVAKSR